MHRDDGLDFPAAFQALTGYEPLRWQRRLFEQMGAGATPQRCNLPTGLGKTSVIPVWLLALAAQARRQCVTLPRRLIYVVNRRTVVDQATDTVVTIRERLLRPDDPAWHDHAATLRHLAGRLDALSPTHDGLPLGISTLRGELADNEEWKDDPARAAVVIGTIDMVGSKLLFSGYGDGRYGRAHHAGLVGQDVLIVHDEAHLTPAFSDVLSGVVEAQCLSGEPRPARVMELSATCRSGGGDLLGLTAEDKLDRLVSQRLAAQKRLRLHEIAQTDLFARIVALAMAHEEKPAKVLIYVRSPRAAQQMARLIRKKLGREGQSAVAVLTGTIRGSERDRLVRSNPVYGALLDPGVASERTVYLVSTSAGEVGIDIDADHMVCDLAPLDSMIQRLGRVNRRGGRGRVARVDVVVEHSEDDGDDDASAYSRSLKATRAILTGWADAAGGEVDVSPGALGERMEGLAEDERSCAFSPKPPVPPLTDILLDAWSLTSVTGSMPGRPTVASYLHGLTHDPPETFVVWRAEVAALDAAGADDHALGDWFGACRVEARERVRSPTESLRKSLSDLLRAHRRKAKDADFPVVLLDERGQAEWARLSTISEKGFPLAYRTVVLPVEAGGLSEDGMFEAKMLEPAADVADTNLADGDVGRRQRWVYTQDEETETYRKLTTGEPISSPPPGLRERIRVPLQVAPEGAEDEAGSRSLLLLTSPQRVARDSPESVRADQPLDAHTRDVVQRVAAMAEALRIDPALKEALCQAAKWHDRGKARPLWQEFACNPAPQHPLGKSRKYRSGRFLGGYRHEFGSLLEAGAHEELPDRPESDLVLHLVAAHHGWARPHFEPRAFDHAQFSTAENQQGASEALRRFARLHQRFGRWGLAWLESLLRCADIAASKHCGQLQSEDRPEENAK